MTKFKEIKWYWKFLIFLLIILFVSSCNKNLGFITNVYAAEKQPSIYFHVEDKNNLKNYNDKLFTNFAFDNNNLVDDISASSGYYYSTSINAYYLDIDTFENLLPSNQPSESFSSFIGSNFPIARRGSANQAIFLNKIRWGTPTSSQKLSYFELDKTSNYELVFQLTKDSSTYIRKNLSSNDIIFNFIFGTDNTTFDSNCIVIDFINFFPYEDVNSSESYYSYLLVKFHLKDLVSFSDTKDYSIYNRSTSFKFSSATFTTDFIKNVDRKSFFQKILYIDDDFNAPLIQVSKVIFLKNGSISFSPNSSVNSNYDNVNINDMIIFNGLNECDSLDISCHFNNFNTLLKSLFVRVGNFFNSFFDSVSDFFLGLFIPDLSELKLIFNDYVSFLHEKLGFLFYPIDLLGNLYVRFSNLSPVTYSDIVINIPEIKEPFYNYTIIQPGVWNIGSIITQPYISQLYIIYKLFITTYIIFLFVGLCYDSFSAFIAGAPVQVSSFTRDFLDSETDTYNTKIVKVRYRR